MAWVRIEDTVCEHRKHLKAGPAACWLWVCGIAYCQRQLSDGFIPVEAVGMLGVPKGFSRLVETLVEVGLFDRVPGGFKVHDYHDFNATREEAEARRLDLHTARSQSGRLGGLRSAATRRAKQNEANGEAKPTHLLEAKRSPIPSHPIPSQKETDASPSSRPDPFLNQTTGDRAGRFIDRYELLYPQHRKGARYAVKPARDYAAAVTLCDTWPDDRLDKLAIIFLTTDHKFAEEGSRTIPQFLALASWADGKLAEHEAKKASA